LPTPSSVAWTSSSKRTETGRPMAHLLADAQMDHREVLRSGSESW
jgi:hypothetical protein